MRCRFIPILLLATLMFAIGMLAAGMSGAGMSGTGLAAGPAARAETTMTVRRTDITDEKAVFATVESPNVVPARARIGGTVARLSVRQGDAVTQGQVIAVVADEKLLLQVSSLDAQIAGLQSQLAQDQSDLARAQTLFHQGAGPRTTLDQARTAVEVATSALRSRTAQRAVAQQNLDEGQVLAPVAGRVITVPLTAGSVVLNGDTIATVGEEPFILRLRVPERHAVSLQAGDAVRIDPGQLGAAQSTTGVITLIYPQIADGRVVADAKVAELGNYFVGDRILVWISAGTRPGYVVPESFLRTRFGLDYVLLRRPDGGTAEIPVQRGEPHPTASLPDGIELLSGVQAGDVLVRP
ncbi:MAG TPA: efflux RND transporter periplasmic adaptor subunit [Acetobacteraceae bacterium]|nr:efflux RND transporter periplasmic adaptor subunit [Acetobacteraceae bacterium]